MMRTCASCKTVKECQYVIKKSGGGGLMGGFSGGSGDKVELDLCNECLTKIKEGKVN